MLKWIDTKLFCLDLGSDISDCDLFVQRIHESYFCRFFSQSLFVFLSEKFGLHEVDFNDPSRPRTAKESAKVLTEIFNTRKIPDRFLDWLHIPDAVAYIKINLKYNILLITSSLKTAIRFIVMEHSCN